MTRLKTAFLALLALLMIVGFTGCSGDATLTERGSIGVAVMFPPRDDVTGASAEKDMPQVTNSVRIEIESLAEGTEGWQRERILDRPDNGDVVRAQIDSVPVGPVRVTATSYDGYDATGNMVGEASAVVTVNADEVTSVTLITDRLAERVEIYEVPMPDGDPPPPLESTLLEPTGQQQVQAKGWDYDGTETAYVDFTWTSNTGMQSADLNADGLVVDPTTGSVVTITAIADGEYEVTVSDGRSGESSTLDVSVVSRPVESIYLEPRESTLYRFGEPDRVQLTAYARDLAEETIAYAELSFVSGDPDVASVDANGLVTAQGQGSCTITVTGATATGSAQAQCRVDVIDTGELDVIVQ